MNQVERQFAFDLQIFAEDAPEVQESTTDAAPSEVTESVEPQATTEQDSQPDKHISEMTDDEQTEYIKRHFLDDEPKEPPQQEPKEEPAQAPQQAAEPQAPAQEPTFEITVQGEKKQVTQSELIKLAQMGEDYTKKCQTLADQRRQFEAQVQQFQQRQQPQQQQVNPTERMNAQYREAVGAACRSMGIKPEEFNQFDPVHAFALQNVIVQANMQVGRQVSERQAVEAEIRDFMTEIQKDPMTQDINSHFEEYILKRGMETREGLQAAGAIAEAYSRFNAGRATKRDCAVLKEHWAYVKSQLSKAQAPVAPPKPPVVPPKTETPGVGRSANNGGGVMDVRKLRSLASDPDRQMQYMKSLGIFND